MQRQGRLQIFDNFSNLLHPSIFAFCKRWRLLFLFWDSCKGGGSLLLVLQLLKVFLQVQLGRRHHLNHVFHSLEQIFWGCWSNTLNLSYAYFWREYEVLTCLTFWRRTRKALKHPTWFVPHVDTLSHSSHTSLEQKKMLKKFPKKNHSRKIVTILPIRSPFSQYQSTIWKEL